MASESIFLPPDTLPSIPSFVDPISTNSTTSLPLTSARVAEVLPQRSRSPNTDGELTADGISALDLGLHGRRGKSASPTRANVKRRRSNGSALSSSAQIHTETNVSSLGNGAPRQRSPSRGRSLRRGTPKSVTSRSRKRRRVGDISGKPKDQSSEGTKGIKESLKVTKCPVQPIIAQLSLSGDDGERNGKCGKVRYEQKGAFRLKKDKREDKFRFPKPCSQPEPLWRAGDGFSSDEARPDFVFNMAGTHKQKKARLLPGIGKLELESEDVSKKAPRQSGTIRSKVQRSSQYETQHRRSVAKDVWPTRENFAEELEVRKQDSTVPVSQKRIDSIIMPQATPEPRARETFEYKPPTGRKRMHSDFENFGQHLQNNEFSFKGGTKEHSADADCTDESGQADGGEFEEAILVCEPEEDEILVYETDKDENEPTVLAAFERDSSNCEGHATTDEKSTSVIQSRELISRDSAISIHEDEELESQEVRPYTDDIWAAGEVGTQIVMSYQAFS
ncbi:hypothetical protein GGR54DRAFT_639395 [Hypoxylon sp. NC1633]|nr:hypothetical protein GGR54DRAFT_639395 [Hypoxylon sp. NC1633]